MQRRKTGEGAWSAEESGSRNDGPRIESRRCCCHANWPGKAKPPRFLAAFRQRKWLCYSARQSSDVSVGRQLLGKTSGELPAAGGWNGYEKAHLPDLRRKSVALALAGLLARERQPYLPPFRLPRIAPSGTDETGCPHIQWRVRTGFSPAFPVRPLREPKLDKVFHVAKRTSTESGISWAFAARQLAAWHRQRSW